MTEKRQTINRFLLDMMFLPTTKGICLDLKGNSPFYAFGTVADKNSKCRKHVLTDQSHLQKFFIFLHNVSR